MEERPLKDRSVEELLDLWKKADQIDDLAHSTLGHITPYSGDCCLTEQDVKMVRAGLMLEWKLCEENGLPIPKKLSSPYFDIQEQSEYDEDDDEYTGERTVYEYECDGNRLIDDFTNINDIGDFSDEDFEEVQCFLDIFDGDETEELPESFIDVAREVAGDEGMCCSVFGVLLTQSAKFGKAYSVSSKNDSPVPKEIHDFFDNFSTALMMRNYYWVDIFSKESLTEDAYMAFSVPVEWYEEGLCPSPLYRHLSLRIGAYIAQELSERVIEQWG